MMKDILQEIVDHKKVEVKRFKEALPESDIHLRVEQDMALTQEKRPSMSRAIMDSDSGIIAEFKRKSPSAGWINRDAKVEEVTNAYQHNGASALSILTDSDFFGGSDKFVSEAIASGVTLPVLYKNFIVDEYQLFQARLCGASAVLLIASVLTLADCHSLVRTAHDLGLEVLLEMHAARELEYADCDPDMFGVNNRNLGTFVTDVANSFRFAADLPTEACLVSESGLSDPSVVSLLREAGYRGFLIGGHFMKSADPGKALGEFISKIKK